MPEEDVCWFSLLTIAYLEICQMRLLNVDVHQIHVSLSLLANGRKPLLDLEAQHAPRPHAGGL